MLCDMAQYDKVGRQLVLTNTTLCGGVCMLADVEYYLIPSSKL